MLVGIRTQRWRLMEHGPEDAVRWVIAFAAPHSRGQPPVPPDYT